jgi:hypothetical protein
MPVSKRTRSVDSLCRELGLETVEIELIKRDDGWYFIGNSSDGLKMPYFDISRDKVTTGMLAKNGAIQTVIKACCLDFLVAADTFRSEDDACNRYLEAQFTIHCDKSAEIVQAVIAAVHRRDGTNGKLCST